MIPLESPPPSASDSSGIIHSDWLAYQAWCEVHSLTSSSPEALNAFVPYLTSSSARATRQRLTHLRRAAGIPAPPNTSPAIPRIWEAAALSAALTRLSHVPEGPQAPAARRDAVALLLLLDLRLSRSQALLTRARTYPVLGLVDRDYAREGDPRSCRACAISRWLRTLAHARLAVDNPGVSLPPAHDCLREIPQGWNAGPLLPEVSRWGQIQAHSPTPVSQRTLTHIARVRLDPRTARSTFDEVAPLPAIVETPRPIPPTMTPSEAARQRRALREELQAIEGLD